MRVLWVCNIMLPAVAEYLGQDYSVREGWLSGTLRWLLPFCESKEVTLGICFPAKGEQAGLRAEIPTAALSQKFPAEGKGPEAVQEAAGGAGRGAVQKAAAADTVSGGRACISCYGFAEDLVHPERYQPELEKVFAGILADFRPEVVHIFGTEFPHALACARAFGRPERTLVSLQGICSAIAENYMADLPVSVQQKVTFRDWLKKDSLKQQQRKFVKRGEHEDLVLRLAGHVAGRTGFDRAAAEKQNPQARYHKLPETMRDTFYTGRWEREKCRTHQIFCSQADYPLKGFHFLLEAMPRILESFPDARVTVAGNSVIQDKTLKDKIKAPAYGVYLRKLIRQYGLEGKLLMLGRLSGEQMKEQYLQSHLLVCPSANENSPNSVAEAMLLGVPVVAARVGGIPDMVTDGEDGLLFDRGDSHGLAQAVIALWQDEDMAIRLSRAAAKRAARVHDRQANGIRLLEIYQEIAKE